MKGDNMLRVLAGEAINGGGGITEREADFLRAVRGCGVCAARLECDSIANAIGSNEVPNSQKCIENNPEFATRVGPYTHKKPVKRWGE
jgi:hypothetical protein